jgi:hypothetical protein
MLYQYLHQIIPPALTSGNLLQYPVTWSRPFSHTVPTTNACTITRYVRQVLDVALGLYCHQILPIASTSEPSVLALKGGRLVMQIVPHRVHKLIPAPSTPNFDCTKLTKYFSLYLLQVLSAITTPGPTAYIFPRRFNLYLHQIL